MAVTGSNKIGLEAIWDNTQFQKGFQQYIASLTQADQTTQQTAGSLTQMGSAAGGAGAGGLLAAGAAAGLAMGAVTALLGVVKEAITGFYNLAASGINLAARIDEVRLTAHLMGAKLGMTGVAVDEMAEKIQDAGIRADVAYKSMTQIARMEMDPALSLGLADAAKNLAVLSSDGADTSATLDRLIWGLTTGNSRILRMAGVTMTATEAEDRFRASTEGVTGALTQAQKKQAMYNEIIRQAANVSGVYDIAMENVGKKLRSLTGRELPSMQAELAEFFLPAWGAVVDTMRQVVEWFRNAMEEGGALHDTLIAMGGTLWYVVEGLTNIVKALFPVKQAAEQTDESIEQLGDDMLKMVGVGDQAGKSFFDSITGWLMKTAEAALGFGVEISVFLANGLIQGANIAITAAMNAISALLSSWLRLSSPPKILPELDEYGIQLTSFWLHSMTKADFGILKGMQGPLKKAFDLLGKDAAQWAEMNMALIGGLAEGGDGAALFDMISAATGPFGEDLALLAMLQNEAAFATENAAQAQLDLNDAKKAAESANTEVNKQTAEYIALQRAGITGDALKAKMEELNAAEDASVLASQEVIDAQDRITAAQEYNQLVQEQLSLQQQIVEQLLGMGEAQAAAFAMDDLDAGLKDLAAAAGGAGVDAGIAFGDGFGDGIDMADPENALKDKMEEFKDMLKEKLDEILQPWRDKKDEWAEIIAGWGEQWAGIGEQWELFIAPIRDFWDAEIQPVIDSISDLVPDDLPEKLLKAAAGALALAKVGKILSSLPTGIMLLAKAFNLLKLAGSGIFALLTSPIFLLAGALLLLQLVWDKFGADAMESLRMLGVIIPYYFDLWKQKITEWAKHMQTRITHTWNNIKTVVAEKLLAVKESITTKIEEIKAGWKTTWESIKALPGALLERAKEIIIAKIDSILAGFGIKGFKLRERWAKIWEDIKEIAAEVWDRIVTAVSNKIQGVHKALVEKLAEIKTYWTTVWTEISTNIKDRWAKIQKAIEDYLFSIGLKLALWLLGVKNKLTNAWKAIKKTLEEKWELIKEAIVLKWTEIYTAITEKVDEIKQYFVDIVQDWIDIGTNIIDGIKQGITNAIGGLILSFTQGIEDAIAAAKALLEESSPSQVFFRIGANTMKGMALGIEDTISEPIGSMLAGVGAMTSSFKAALNPVMATSPMMSSSVSNSTNVYMGGQTISNGMDRAVVKQIVMEVLRSK